MIDMIGTIKKIIGRKRGYLDINSSTPSNQPMTEQRKMTEKNDDPYNLLGYGSYEKIKAKQNMYENITEFRQGNTTNDKSYVERVKNSSKREKIMKKDDNDVDSLKKQYEEKYSEENIRRMTKEAQKMSDFADKYFEDKNTDKGNDNGKGR